MTDTIASTTPSRDVRFWDRIARKYAASPIKDIAGYERTIARIAQLLGPTQSVLEIGCGTGTTALKLAPLVARLADRKSTRLNSSHSSVSRMPSSA